MLSCIGSGRAVVPANKRCRRPASSGAVTLICLVAVIELLASGGGAGQSQVAATAASSSSGGGTKAMEAHQQQQQQQHDDKDSARKNALEAIVRQHESLDDRSLADAIISRLMDENVFTGGGGGVVGLSEPTPGGGGAAAEFSPESGELSLAADNQAAEAAADQDGMVPERAPFYGKSALGGGGPPDSMNMRKLWSAIRSYESSGGGAGAGSSRQAFSQFPVLPSSQAATMKRAAASLGNYLQQRQIGDGGGGGGGSPAANNGYGRNMFDFGLGKRPDTGGASSNILRLSDSLTGGAGTVQAVNQFGKRPGAHRYDFGLGKRVASSAYPRYDFGLGKRAPNRIRYDFGLGK